MATFAANLTSCSAETVNVLSWVWGGGGGGEPSFTYNRGIRFFACPSHVAEMPAFCMQGTRCKMQPCGPLQFDDFVCLFSLFGHLL